MKPAAIQHDSPDQPFTIIGDRIAEMPTCGISVVVHRCISLEKWTLQGRGAPMWRLYLPISPGAHAKTGDSSTALEPGDLYLIPPHTEARCWADAPFTLSLIHI